MNRFATLIILASALAMCCHRSATAQGTPAAADPSNAGKETQYLAFQIFTYYSPDPKVASLMSSGSREPLVPGSAALKNYVLDIKQRIGTIGDRQTRLAVMLGPLCFEQSDAEIAEFIQRAFDLALETDVAVGFHIDDSIFWARRKDLWSDPSNVEALDWDGTPCTGRRLDWGKNPSAAPPQMCFNSNAVRREVQQRSAILGKAIAAGVNRLRELKRPELFAGAIAGWETMIGQDFATGKHLGYRALLNRGFTREHPPRDMDAEREKVVQEFIDLWTSGLADAGVSPQKIYSHTAFLSRKSFNLGGDEKITYMRHDKEDSYSQHNHFAPPSVAFGPLHRPGFSTYPQPGLFDDIYVELAQHKQVGWASCEGTDMQPSTGPGQTGMNMETYLAKMFNHGAAVVNIFAWGVGGPAMKNMDFRVVTEGEESIRAYRKFLSGQTLIEDQGEAMSLMERLPSKLHKIQRDLPAWIEKADAGNKQTVAGLMEQLQKSYNAKNFSEVEKRADSILKIMADSEFKSNEKAAQPTAVPGDSSHERVPEEARRQMRHNIDSSFVVFRDTVQAELKLTDQQKAGLDEALPEVMQFLQTIQGLTPEERKKELKAYRPRAREKLAVVLKATLNPGQLARLRQIVLQREGLRNGEIWKELQLTDEQQMQFITLMQQAQRETQTLIEEIQTAGKLKEIQPKVIKVREDLEAKLAALLTDAQKSQWKDMLGKPMALSDLFDL